MPALSLSPIRNVREALQQGSRAVTQKTDQTLCVKRFSQNTQVFPTLHYPSATELASDQGKKPNVQWYFIQVKNKENQLVKKTVSNQRQNIPKTVNKGLKISSSRNKLLGELHHFCKNDPDKQALFKQMKLLTSSRIVKKRQFNKVPPDILEKLIENKTKQNEDDIARANATNKKKTLKTSPEDFVKQIKLQMFLEKMEKEGNHIFVNREKADQDNQNHSVVNKVNPEILKKFISKPRNTDIQKPTKEELETLSWKKNPVNKVSPAIKKTIEKRKYNSNKADVIIQLPIKPSKGEVNSQLTFKIPYRHFLTYNKKQSHLKHEFKIQVDKEVDVFQKIKTIKEYKKDPVNKINPEIYLGKSTRVRIK